MPDPTMPPLTPVTAEYAATEMTTGQEVVMTTEPEDDLARAIGMTDCPECGHRVWLHTDRCHAADLTATPCSCSRINS